MREAAREIFAFMKGIPYAKFEKNHPCGMLLNGN
jgi:hypothetical protein